MSKLLYYISKLHWRNVYIPSNIHMSLTDSGQYFVLTPIAGKKKNYTISIKKVPTIVENNVVKILRKHKGYGPWKGKPIQTKGITRPQILSLHRQILRQKYIKKDAYKLQRNYKKIQQMFNNKVNILEISDKYHLPPMSVFVKLLCDKYNIETQELWDNSAKYLTKAELSMFKNIPEYDCLDTISPVELLRLSDKYEEKIATWLNANNIKYRDQQKLVEQQIEKFGKAVATPDFLLEQPIVINGSLVNWIEAKNYYGTTHGFTHAKTKKQVKKYSERFGKGALCFALGCAENIKFDNTVIISI